MRQVGPAPITHLQQRCLEYGGIDPARATRLAAADDGEPFVTVECSVTFHVPRELFLTWVDEQRQKEPRRGTV